MTVKGSVMPALTRRQILAVVAFGCWKDGRAVTAAEAGWRNGTVMAIATSRRRLKQQFVAEQRHREVRNPYASAVGCKIPYGRSRLYRSCTARFQTAKRPRRLSDKALNRNEKSW